MSLFFLIQCELISHGADSEREVKRMQIDKLQLLILSILEGMNATTPGTGMAEKFCEDNGIGTYTMDRENGLLIDNQTGEIAKVSNKPSFMQIVK